MKASYLSYDHAWDLDSAEQATKKQELVSKGYHFIS